MRTTRTYAILEVDPEIYKKIRAQLEEAGYGHAFHRGNNDDEVIDMNGIALQAKPRLHYPPGMGEESRRLHREYNVLVAAQRNGARNGAEVVKLTDECNAKGIILVPNGENL
jgi:hypothetical protein